MKLETILLLSITTLALSGILLSQYQPNQQETYQLKQVYQNKFEIWKDEHHVSYQNQGEELYRFSVFMDNEDFIDHWNEDHQGENDVKLAENDFTDMTDEEFFQTHFGLIQDEEQKIDKLGASNEQEIWESSDQYLSQQNKLQQSSMKERYDFRYLNKQGVRNQKCGDCWANSAALVTELAFFKNEKVSVQDLINCEPISNGCSGGKLDSPLEYFKNKGVAFENDVPYQGKDQICQNVNRIQLDQSISVNYFNNPGAHLSHCSKLKEMNSQQGPITVGLFAEQSKIWKNYSSGILEHDLNASWRLHPQEPSRINSNHAVVLMGFTNNYWIIQNSWGSSWGEQGTARIRMGDYFNICHQFSGYKSNQYRFQSEQQTQFGPYFGNTSDVLEQYREATGHRTWVVLTQKNKEQTHHISLPIISNRKHKIIALKYSGRYIDDVEAVFKRKAAKFAKDNTPCKHSGSKIMKEVRTRLQRQFPDNYVSSWYNTGFSSYCIASYEYTQKCPLTTSKYHFCLT